MIELPYERIAMNGGEMPKDLSFPDHFMFQQLAVLYARYKRGEVDREQARKQKAGFLKSYQFLQNIEEVGTRWIEQCKNAEIARSEYRKNRTLENADRLVDILDGILK